MDTMVLVLRRSHCSWPSEQHIYSAHLQLQAFSLPRQASYAITTLPHANVFIAFAHQQPTATATFAATNITQTSILSSGRKNTHNIPLTRQNIPSTPTSNMSSASTNPFAILNSNKNAMKNPVKASANKPATTSVPTTEKAPTMPFGFEAGSTDATGADLSSFETVAKPTREKKPVNHAYHNWQPEETDRRRNPMVLKKRGRGGKYNGNRNYKGGNRNNNTNTNPDNWRLGNSTGSDWAA